MTTADAEPTEIAKISEATSDATLVDIKPTRGGGYKATIDELIKFLEDEEDIREGLKALADEKGTVTWEQYRRKRAERVPG